MLAITPSRRGNAGVQSELRAVVSARNVRALGFVSWRLLH